MICDDFALPMRVALAIYAGGYIIAITVTIVANLKSKAPLWDSASDVILLPLGLVGMILYGFGVANHDVKLVWKLLAPLIIVGQVATNLLGRYLTKKRSVTERDAVWFSDVFTVILLLPMFMINFAFAFR
jgi:hypothetical protein